MLVASFNQFKRFLFHAAPVTQQSGSLTAMRWGCPTAALCDPSWVTQLPQEQHFVFHIGCIASCYENSPYALLYLAICNHMPLCLLPLQHLAKSGITPQQPTQLYPWHQLLARH